MYRVNNVVLFDCKFLILHSIVDIRKCCIKFEQDQQFFG